DQQAETLRQMIAEQRELTQAARTNLAAGLITTPDYTKEEQALNQMHLALIENGRTRAQTALPLSEALLAQDSLSGHAPPMPQVIVAQDLLVRVELELFKLEAVQRAREAERKSIEERIGSLDNLEAQLRSRPLYQATQRKLDVAFVPYTQLDG